ncbi:MAG: hypothetical protein GC200_07980 [Tepidisphaera sp.]|nr:hypothetical protein [Tepidisphaera sp.]
MQRLIDTLGGLYELARLGVITGFRFKGPYWTWRLHTAFGRGYPSRWETLKSILDYGIWIWRLRKR